MPGIDPESIDPDDPSPLKIVAAITAIEDHLEETNKDKLDRTVSGRIDCPVSGRDEGLRWRVSGYNGHKRAECETDDCVWFME
jgi:hypothetical protein